MSSATTRLQAIAAMHAAHDEQLRRLVARRANANDATIDDACSYAWTSLVTVSTCASARRAAARWRG